MKEERQEQMESNEKLINFFCEAVDNLSKISRDEVRDVVSLATIVLTDSDASEELKIKSFGLLCDIATHNFLTVEERWYLYWILVCNSFISPKFDKYDMAIRNIYAGIYFEVEKAMPDSVRKETMPEVENAPVVIVTNQFVGLGHAPTRRVMDYAYTIQSKMGIPVVIVNDAGMNLKRFPYMRFGMEFRYKSEYNDFTKMVYKDTVFGFYQVSTAMLDVHEVETLVYNIKMLSPRLVLNVGASCLTADLCRHFAKTASIPCAISIPTSMADYLVLCRELRLADQQNLEAMQPWQKLIQSVYNYIMPDADTMSSYCRRDFEIEEEDWLIVTVGNRMQEEMDDDFLAMVDNVLGELPDSHFLIIGGIRDQSVIADKFVNRQRVHFAGAILDGSQAIRLADVYIHPTRKGGGRAAFEALYYGVPVITTKYGDTWDTCGKQFGVESYQEMKERLEGYYYDQEVYDHMRQISRARGLELEDVRGMFEKLFSDLDVEYP